MADQAYPERRRTDRRKSTDRRQRDRRNAAPRWRMLARFTLLYLVVFGLQLVWFYRFSTQVATDQLRNDLRACALGTAQGIDVAELVGLAATGRPNASRFSDDPRYGREMAWFETVHRLNPQAWPYTFVASSKDKGQCLYLADLNATHNREKAAHFLEADQLSEWSQKALEGGETQVRPAVYSDKFGSWLSAYTPLKDASGKVAGVVGVDFDASYVREVQGQVARQMGSIFIGAYFLISLVGLYIYRVRHLRVLFGRYVSLSLLRDIALLELGYASRRRVTVLFTDINNFSTQCEQHTAEEVIEMLNRYFEAMNEIIVASGGWIKQFVGDEIMVIYGAPDEHPRPARAAIEAALSMVEKLKQMKSEAQEPGFFEVKVGIHTGDVIVGNVGSRHRTEYAAVGDHVNLGSRIMGMCKSLDATVLVSSTTHEMVGDMPGVAFVDKGSHPVKGRLQKVQVFEVTATDDFQPVE